MFNPFHYYDMPNTYSQIYIQFVFALKGRENLVEEEFKEEHVSSLQKSKTEFDEKYVFEFYD